MTPHRVGYFKNHQQQQKTHIPCVQSPDRPSASNPQSLMVVFPFAGCNFVHFRWSLCSVCMRNETVGQITVSYFVSFWRMQLWNQWVGGERQFAQNSGLNFRVVFCCLRGTYQQVMKICSTLEMGWRYNSSVGQAEWWNFFRIYTSGPYCEIY